MLVSLDQRRILGAFLRDRRERLSPEKAGLKAAGRRRTPGLRREEVAQLSGLSTTWLTWAEQGRDIALSDAALSRLAAALRLTAAERAYLFELTRRRDPEPLVRLPSPPAAPPELGAALDAITAPAYLLDWLWHARGWNAPAARLFAPWLSSGETNLLRYVFLDRSAPRFIRDWNDRARRLIAEFRADTARDPDNRALRALVDELTTASPQFARLWRDQAVLAREGGLRSFDHPEDGPVSFTQITLVPATPPGHKLVMLLPTVSTSDVDADL